MNRKLIVEIILYILTVPTAILATLCFIGKENKDKKLIKKYIPFFIICIVLYIVLFKLYYMF